MTESCEVCGSPAVFQTGDPRKRTGVFRPHFLCAVHKDRWFAWVHDHPTIGTDKLGRPRLGRKWQEGFGQFLKEEKT